MVNDSGSLWGDYMQESLHNSGYLNTRKRQQKDGHVGEKKAIKIIEQLGGLIYEETLKE